jgi:hypothetical protein
MMTTTTTARVCRGCGNPLTPPARKWCSERCRKAQYGTPCLDCGRPTYGGDGAGAHPRCRSCNTDRQQREARWTPDAIVDAIRAWAAEHGRPPTATDWRTAPDGTHPADSVVVEKIGWNRAIELAGYQPNRALGPGPGTLTEDDLARTAMLADRHGAAEAGRILGISENAVHQRLTKHRTGRYPSTRRAA